MALHVLILIHTFILICYRILLKLHIMKTFPTTPQAGYIVTVATTPCTVSAIMPDNSTIVLLRASEPGQYGIAAPASAVTTSQDDALLTKTSGVIAFASPGWNMTAVSE